MNTCICVYVHLHITSLSFMVYTSLGIYLFNMIYIIYILYIEGGEGHFKIENAAKNAKFNSKIFNLSHLSNSSVCF